MLHSFYDVKAKKKVKAEVTKKVTYGKKGNERFRPRLPRDVA